MNLKAYAAHRKARGLKGTSHVAVLKAIDSGRLTRASAVKVNGYWEIDPVEADREWAANTLDKSAPAPASPADPPDEAPAPAPQKRERSARREPAAPPQEPNAPNRNISRAVKDAYEAQIAKLNYEERSGQLVSKDEVFRLLFSHSRAARDAFRSIGARVIYEISDIMGGLTDQQRHRIQQALDAELMRVQERLEKFPIE